MSDNLVGVFAWLAALGPVWTFVVLYTAFVIIVWPMRWLTEGRTYNVSRGHLWGDLCLCVLIASGAGLLQEPGIVVPDWLGKNVLLQLIVFGLCELAAVVAWLKFFPYWEETFAEKYHTVVTVPALLFLIAVSVSVAAFNMAGNVLLLQAACAEAWYFLVNWDFKNGRAKQQQWLADHPDYRWVISRK